jgi:hypothetical protein
MATIFSVLKKNSSPHHTTGFPLNLLTPWKVKRKFGNVVLESSSSYSPSSLPL